MAALDALDVRRVSQSDAFTLDEQLGALLRAAMKAAMNRAQRGIYERWEPELHAALQAVMFRGALWGSDATYGMKLLGLRYRDERAHWTKPCRRRGLGRVGSDAVRART